VIKELFSVKLKKGRCGEKKRKEGNQDQRDDRDDQLKRKPIRSGSYTS